MRIVLIGKSKSGRSACATYLVDKYRFKMMGVEDGPKEIIRKFYYFGQYKKVDWTFRMKVYDFLYSLDNNIFINHLVRKLGQTRKTNVVVPDIRYINELKVLQEMGFVTVRIVAPEVRRQKYIPTASHLEPNSVILAEWFNRDKTGGIKADFTIFNGSRAGVKEALDSLVSRLADKENLTLQVTHK